MKGKKIIARAIGVLVAMVVLAAAGVLLLQSRVFQRFLLARLEQTASAALGTEVHVEGIDIRLSDLSVDLRGITIRCNQANAPQPLLSVPHIGLNFKIISALRLEWNLNSVTIDHPVVHILADGYGKNTPTPQNSSASSRSVFDLAVGHAVIHGGELYYNDAKRALSADFHDLEFQARYDSATGGRYYGKLEYRQGKLLLGQYNAIPHDLRASFSATREELALNPLVLASGPSRLELVASLRDYASPRITGQYQATLVADDFRRMLNSPTLPSGTVRLAGTVEYQTVAGRPPIESVTLAGDLSSDVVKVHTPRFRGEIRDISARYAITDGNARVPQLRARLLGGALEGNLTIRDLAGQAQSRMQATLKGISLSELEPLAPAQATKDVRLTGQMDGKLDATWVRSMQDLVANLDVSIGGEANSPKAMQANAAAKVPLTGFIHGNYIAAREQVALSNSSLRTRQSSILVNGTLSRQSSLRIHAQSGDLHELETIASIFSAGDGRPVQPLALSGAASFTGEIRGSTTSPTLSGQLRGTKIQVKGSSWRSVRAYIRAGPAEVVLQDGHLEPEAQGQIELSGQASLTHWSYAPENAFTLGIKASQLSAANIAMVAGIQAPVSGVVNANVSLHGSQLNPVGQGRVFLSKAAVSGEVVERAELQFRGTGDSLTGTLDLHIPAGAARGEFKYYPKQLAYQATLEATDLQLEKLSTIQRKKLGIAGALNLEARGTGTLRDPALEATLSVPQLRLQDEYIRQFSLQASVKNHVATIDLSSQAAGTGVQAHGTVSLQDQYDADLKLDTGTIPLQPLAAIYAPDRAGDFAGQTELHATVRGPLKNKQLLQAHASIPVLKARYKAIELAAARPVQIDYANGVFNVQRFEIQGPDTKLEFEGRIPANRQAPVTAHLLGNVNLSLLQALAPAIRSTGRLQFNINSFGSVAAPGLQGEIRIVNASVLSEGAPLGLRNGNGVLTVKNDRVAIESFQGDVGGGTVTARGGVGLSPHVHFDVALSGNGIQLLYPEGVRSSFETSLTLSGNLQEAFLRGQANVDHISLSRDFDLSRIAQEFQETAGTPSSGFANQIHLNVSLRTTSEVNLSGRTLSLQGGANLQLQGTLAHPVALGRVDVAGGDVIFLTNRYEITGGLVEFANPTRTEPILNLSATTTINEYNISLRLEGPLDSLRTSYTSDPSLPPVDIINLLAFGKTTESGSPSASTSQFGALGVESVLASGISSQVAGRVERLAGISQLSIEPVLGPQQGNPGARIVVRQRVTSRLFVTFSGETVSSSLNQVIQVRYQLNTRWSVAADVDQNGGFAFEARVRKEF